MANTTWEIMANVNLYHEGIRTVVERDRAFTGWDAAAIKVMLTTASYTPSQTHTAYTNASAYEISGGDYSVGGQLLSGKTIATSANQLLLDANDSAWSNLLVKPRYALIYDATNAVAGQRSLFGYVDLGTLKGKRTKLRIRWPARAVLTLTVENAVGFP